MISRLIVLALLIAATVSASAKDMWIPIAGVAPGANETLFRTDLRIFNPSSTKTIGVTIHFLPANMDGRNISGRIVTVPPRSMAVLNNVVGDFMQIHTPMVGALRLDSADDQSWEFTAESRTYTDSPTGPGTYGQFIPAMHASAAKHKLVVTHLSHSADISTGFRTNVGVMNPSSEEAVVTPRVYRNDGALLIVGEPIVVPPHSVVQTPLGVIHGIGSFNLPDGFVVLDSSQPVFAYASVVDNRSSDPFFVVGVEDTEDRQPIR
ncbi:MAG TPA: hypothetical protein VF618_20505 [Thermoanaerobaculia bacterium]